MAVDYGTPAGQVRLLIADVDDYAPTLTDDQVTGFLALNGGNVRRAAADALDAIASSETLVSKVIHTQDLATDGPKVATDLRAHATRLRALADEEDAAGDGGWFDVVDFPSHAAAELVEPSW